MLTPSSIEFVHSRLQVYFALYNGTASLYFTNRTAAYWQDLAPAITDNYATRSFLGDAGFHLPAGSLNMSHLSLAQQQLLQYDILLILEAHASNDLTFKHAMGWLYTLDDAHDKNSKK